jgi:hypothetical protein
MQTRSVGGNTLTRQPDGSLLASGRNPPTDSYVITAKTSFERITGIRIEALPDLSLPRNGPGRAVNGDFALCELRVTCSPDGNAKDLHLHPPGHTNRSKADDGR